MLKRKEESTIEDPPLTPPKGRGIISFAGRCIKMQKCYQIVLPFRTISFPVFLMSGAKKDLSTSKSIFRDSSRTLRMTKRGRPSSLLSNSSVNISQPFGEKYK